MNILLSIVIPIYKVEQYIEKCLNSIYGQIENLPVEVILVNDGTPDKSMDIAQKFVNNRTVIVAQENQGLSAARNNGMKASHGEYVWFVDSDDWIAEGAIGKVCKFIDKIRSDVFVVGIKAFDDKSSPIDSFHPISPVDSIKTKTGAEWILTPHFERGPMQIFVMRRQFLEGEHLEFVKGLLHEDLEFAPKMLVKAHRVTFIPENVYCYLIRSSGSITSTVNPKRFTDLFFILKEHEQLLKVLSGSTQKKAIKTSQWMLLRTLITYLKRQKYEGMNLCNPSYNGIIRKVSFRSFFVVPKLTYKIKFLLTGIYPNIYKYIKW